jgi:hypothetical protein
MSVFERRPQAAGAAPLCAPRPKAPTLRHDGKAWAWETLSPSKILAIDYPLLVVQEIGARWSMDYLPYLHHD